ncbi:MAG: hypothetical protein GXY67_11455 [Clostridiales bacterium]|nr:hypothetical protein [Clostridiales bacterium]
MAETLGYDNPFRYRGYEWDEETGLYYLRNRYYNPEWGRFINADVVLEKFQLLGVNLYCYCRNSPVIHTDSSGMRPADEDEAREYFIIKAIKRMTSAAALRKYVSRCALAQLAANAKEAKKHVLAPTDPGNKNIGEDFLDKLWNSDDQVVWFMLMVAPEMPWDYKFKGSRPVWAVIDEFEVAGRTVDLHEYGNINFGFVGSAQGWTLFELVTGSAAVALVTKGDLSAGGLDGAGDQELIQWGYDLYNQMMGK